MIYPHSFYPVSASRTFPNIHIGGGSNSQHESGLGVIGSLSANSIWRLRFSLPPVLPSGVCKLRLLALSNANSGNAIVQVFWNKCPVGSDPSAVTLLSEGSFTVSWASGDANKYKELKVVLDETSMSPSNIIVMDLNFLTSGFTLTAISTWIPFIIWE